MVLYKLTFLMNLERKHIIKKHFNASEDTVVNCMKHVDYFYAFCFGLVTFSSSLDTVGF